MGKPRLIILIRHAQSEGNKNRDIHQTVPDHRVRLTPEGHQQAFAAGCKLRALLRPDDTLHFFTSPYRRTRQTTEGILEALTSDEPSPSQFPRHTIKVYEEPRLREQDFGNFQPGSAEMERMWQERADYGHFFYRIPNGESAADAYDRISGFNDSLWRRFEENDFASVCILVTHGLMTRVFLMKWYHFSVEYFEDLRNVNHCEFVVMKRSMDSGKYLLQNHLRTWTELKEERAARDSAGPTPLENHSPIPQRRRWAGCSDARDHPSYNRVSRLPPLRQNTSDLFSDDDDQDSSSSARVSEVSDRRKSFKANQTGPLSFQQTTVARPATSESKQCDASRIGDDKALPKDQPNMCDQASNKLPSVSSSTPFTVNGETRPTKSRPRPTQLLSFMQDRVVGGEESLADLNQDDMRTPRPFHPESLTDRPDPIIISDEAARQGLRSPRESTSTTLTGHPKHGARSGTRRYTSSSTSASSSSFKEDDELGRANERGLYQQADQDEGAEGDAEDETEDETDPGEEGEEDEEGSDHTPSLIRSTTKTTAISNNPISLSMVLRGQPIPIPNPSSLATASTTTTSTAITKPTHPNDPSTPPSQPLRSLHLTTITTSVTGSNQRAMADFLGDQSDAEVTEDDEEMGIRLRQRSEEERILAQERKERKKIFGRVGQQQEK